MDILYVLYDAHSATPPRESKSIQGNGRVMAGKNWPPCRNTAADNNKNNIFSN